MCLKQRAQAFPVEAFSSPCHGKCFSLDNKSSLKRKSSGKNVTLPAVFKALIRLDIVNFICTNLHKTTDNPTLSMNYQVIKPLPSLWVLAGLWLQFPEFEAVGLTVLAGVLLEICTMGPPICANQNLTTSASQSKHNTEVICYLLCPGCLSLTILLVMSKSYQIEDVPEVPLVAEVI